MSLVIRFSVRGHKVSPLPNIKTSFVTDAQAFKLLILLCALVNSLRYVIIFFTRIRNWDPMEPSTIRVHRFDWYA